MQSFKEQQAAAGYANKFTRHYFLCITALTVACLTASSQKQMILNPDAYHNFIRTNTFVKVQTIENGKVQQTESGILNNIQIPVAKKKVIPYEKKIAAIDKASFQKLITATPLQYTAEDIQVIPELHIEPIGGQAEAATYRIVFAVQKPLHYNDSLKKFIAGLGFFLISESGSSTTIIEPVDIQVVSNDVSVIKPDFLKINHLSIPIYHVELNADHVNDSAGVKIITASNAEGYTIYLKVKPVLEISTNRNKLQGFGIQEIPVTVRFVGSNSSDSVQVNFSAEKGTVTPNSVQVAYNKPATIYLRSEGIGNSKLSATSSMMKSNDLNFRFAFPWFFLLASILGGLTGSLAKYYITVKGNKSWIKPVIGGILIGFIGAIAYYSLGVNLLGISLSAGLNEIAVLALSALCAYFGIGLLKLDGKK